MNVSISLNGQNNLESKFQWLVSKDKGGKIEFLYSLDTFISQLVNNKQRRDSKNKKKKRISS